MSKITTEQVLNDLRQIIYEHHSEFGSWNYDVFKAINDDMAILQEKEIINSRPAQGDPDDSLECLSCGNDITNAILDEMKYCYHCGQKIAERK